jgi:hypothetical protein
VEYLFQQELKKPDIPMPVVSLTPLRRTQEHSASRSRQARINSLTQSHLEYIFNDDSLFDYGLAVLFLSIVDFDEW